MNPLATVNGKLPKFAALVILTLAFLGVEIPEATVQAQPSRSVPTVPKGDGSYLYGEIPKPNQIGKQYVVFQRQKGKVVGALYLPNSEFSCFRGSQNNNTLDVKSLNAGDHKVGLAKINLSSLHPIKSLSANELRLISTCKQATVALTNK
ncbi:MAG TPA: hypothetical protein DCP31_01360 [Cyanobacteria bacterium UBA8543]|nr:hypothetical protein [Cyanobacteria bacterium UBA8543]